MLTASNRRYDIDWVRVIAIGLLLIYHVAIGFQPWGIMLGFITNKEPWPALWTAMTMLNVWRIPLLFFVSGMGVYFALQNRTWKQLILERARRILVPYVFGVFVIFPASMLIWQYYNNWNLDYGYSPGHLWFLGNIFAYVVILTPLFFYLKKNENGKVVSVMKKMLSNPLGWLPVMGVSVAEAVLVNPNPYEMYSMTWHGFFLGLLAFFFGFCFVLSGDGFWKMILKWRWVFLSVAVGLYTYRFFQPFMRVPNYLLAIESIFWIISVFAFGYRYLNHDGNALRYLSQAAYPVYILHMIFLALGSALIFPMQIHVYLKFILVLLFTIAGCFAGYEVIRRIKFIRPLFGLKINDRETAERSVNANLKQVYYDQH